MGSYTEIFINNKEIYGFKNGVDLEFTEQLFRAEDQIKCSVMPSDQVGYEESQTEASDSHIEVNYIKSDVGKLKDRLNLLGYSKKSYELDFAKFKEWKVADLGEELAATDNLKYERVEDFATNQITKREFEFWKHVELDKFISAATKIIKENFDWKVYCYEDIRQFENYENYLLSQSSYLVDAMPFFDKLNSFAAIIEQLESEQSVIQDLTSLVNGGWIKEGFRLSGLNNKIIIITEGSSDVNILKPSLKLLYPHLTGYFSFMDFKAFKTQGSASSLLHTMKAFASAGISNKTIALFDNDTAARDVLETINLESFPENFRLLLFPEIEIAKNYPTLGPTGEVEMDINGLACSIEIFTGSDVLKNENGNFYPIQWKGYNKKLNAYQGEILEKKRVQEKFQMKLENAKNNQNVDLQDWTGIEEIFRVLFNAFN